MSAALCCGGLWSVATRYDHDVCVPQCAHRLTLYRDHKALLLLKVRMMIYSASVLCPTTTNSLLSFTSIAIFTFVIDSSSR